MSSRAAHTQCSAHTRFRNPEVTHLQCQPTLGIPRASPVGVCMSGPAQWGPCSKSGSAFLWNPFMLCCMAHATAGQGFRCVQGPLIQLACCARPLPCPFLLNHSPQVTAVHLGGFVRPQRQPKAEEGLSAVQLGYEYLDINLFLEDRMVETRSTQGDIPTPSHGPPGGGGQNTLFFWFVFAFSFVMLSKCSHAFYFPFLLYECEL